MRTLRGPVAATIVAVVTFALAAVEAAPPTTRELVTRLPQGSEAAFAVDTAVLRQQPLVLSWLEEHQSFWTGFDEETAWFFREAGLDAVRDVDAIVFALTAREPKPTWLALVSGNFDPAALGSAIAKRGAKAQMVAGALVYRMEADDEDAAFVHIGSDALVFGDETTIAAALAKEHAGSTLVAAEVDAGRLDLGAPFWFVTTVPEQTRHATVHATQRGARQPLREAVLGGGAVRTVTMQATLADSLHLTAWALADNAENAALLRDAVRGALAAMRLDAQATAPELVEVLRQVKVTSEGSVVRSGAAVPVVLLERLAGGKDGERPHVKQ